MVTGQSRAAVCGRSLVATPPLIEPGMSCNGVDTMAIWLTIIVGSHCRLSADAIGFYDLHSRLDPGTPFAANSRADPAHRTVSPLERSCSIIMIQGAIVGSYGINGSGLSRFCLSETFQHSAFL